MLKKSSIKEKFSRLWIEHIRELNGLMWNLEPKDCHRLGVIRNELYALVIKAEKNRGEKI